jgi:hypothetical protein
MCLHNAKAAHDQDTVSSRMTDSKSMPLNRLQQLKKEPLDRQLIDPKGTIYLSASVRTTKNRDPQLHILNSAFTRKDLVNCKLTDRHHGRGMGFS